jgi:release factor glutamine methyltransferase
MTKQELCQVLEKWLGDKYNYLEIKAINNHFYPFIMQDHILGNLLTEEVENNKHFTEIIEEIRSGVPIQYIIGNTCFYGLDLRVNKDVLIPRSETEELVSWVIEDSKFSNTPLKVVDIGTGSGCIAITLKKHRPHWVISGIDISDNALQIAKQNAAIYQLDIEFMLLDFLKNRKGLNEDYDIIVSNPPYVSIKEKNVVSDSVLNYEPHQALFATGNDPLIFYREIADWAKDHLCKSGSMYLEMNEFLFSEIQNIFVQAGYSKIIMKDDLQGKKRMIKVQF